MRLKNLDRQLLRAEHAIALLDRCRPLNGPEERARVLSEWMRGSATEPRFVYASAPELSELRAQLDFVAEQLAGLSEWGRLYAERVRELASEARLAEVVGTPALRGLAERHYRHTQAEADAARACAAEFIRAPAGGREARAPLHRSDDEDDPESLLEGLRSAVGALRLPVRIELQRELVSAAATTLDGRILVRMGALHTAGEVRRIVVHEIHGHALPRLRARSEPFGLFLLGSARSAEDEEGRALLLEERSAALEPSRRADLAYRHYAALSVRQGASFTDTVRALLAHGAELQAAIETASRAHRGGGLAREIVYLTGFCRVRAALDQEPELETWLQRGRLSLSAARTLRDLGTPPEELDVTYGAPA